MEAVLTLSNHEPRTTVPAPAAITASDVTRRFGEGDTSVQALRGVSLRVASGQLTAVMGPSGSGKSTLMHILAGLDRPTGGSVEIAGTEITGLGDKQLTRLRRDHIGFIFQFFNLLPMLTARENVLLPLELSGTKPDEAWVEELTHRVGLTQRLSHRPSELSGGQQQRVAVARALVGSPLILLADEPTGNLDSHNGEAVMDLLHQLHEQGATICMVTHDPRFTRRADRTVHLFDGQIVDEAEAAALS
jgi:putative ABC transport system ATP-binding protein